MDKQYDVKNINIDYDSDEDQDLEVYTNNSNIPKPPKPGEYMYCQLCGKPILPNQLSKDKEKRKKELKWHIHYDCYFDVDRYIDIQTPGLYSERYGKKENKEYYDLFKKEFNRIKNESKKK